MNKKPENQASTESSYDRIDGDPGVEGLLTDPLAPQAVHEKPNEEKGDPSADPAPPGHHGDWTPTKTGTE